MKNIASVLSLEGDYTIRLSKCDHKQYVFVLLLFDGKRGSWVVRLVDQNSIISFGEDETARSFQEAKQILIDKIEDFCSQFPEYKITKVQTGYDIPPWLKRKRAIPFVKALNKQNAAKSCK